LPNVLHGSIFPTCATSYTPLLRIVAIDSRPPPKLAVTQHFAKSLTVRDAADTERWNLQPHIVTRCIKSRPNTPYCASWCNKNTHLQIRQADFLPINDSFLSSLCGTDDGTCSILPSGASGSDSLSMLAQYSPMRTACDWPEPLIGSVNGSFSRAYRGHVG
jgi:hypothetical protein